MVSITVFFLLICSGSFLGTFVWNRHFTESLPITCVISIFIMFLFGLSGRLALGFYVLLFLAVSVVMFSCVHSVIHHSIRDDLKQLFSADFICFSSLAVLFLIGDYGMEAIGWDEFSHWMDTVKVMTYLDDFGTNPTANTFFPSYPPGIALFQYVLQKLMLFWRVEASASGEQFMLINS